MRYRIFRRPVIAADGGLLDDLPNILEMNTRGTQRWDPVQETKGETHEWHPTNSNNGAPPGKKHPSSQSTTGYRLFNTPDKSGNGDLTPGSPKKAQETEDYRELRRKNSTSCRQPLHQRLATTAPPPLFARIVRSIPLESQIDIFPPY